MISQESTNKCPVCLSPFDSDKHIPKIFPTCGHTVCEECLVQILKTNSPKCPLDKVNFGNDFRSIESFPTNFLVKDLIEKKTRYQSCPSHPKEQSKLICMIDHTFVCGSCVLFGDHKDHDIRLLSEIYDEANIKKDQLSEILQKIASNGSKTEKLMKKKEQDIEDVIRNRFMSLRQEIEKQEEYILIKLAKMVKQERAAMINPQLVTKTSEIKNKLKEFPQVLANPNMMMEVLKEDFTELQKFVADELAVNSEKIKEFSSLISTFKKALPTEKLLKKFNDDTISQILDEFNEKRKFKVDTFVAPELSMDYKGKDSLLEVQKWNDRKSKEDSRIAKLTLEKVEKVQYSLDLEDETSDRDAIMPALLNLSKILPNAKSFTFNFEAKGKTDPLKHDGERLQKILSATLSQPENYEKLEFTIRSCEPGDLGFLFLTESILPKMKNLKSFILKFEYTQVSAKVLKALAQVNWKDYPHLEQLRFYFSKNVLEENDFLEFFNAVPNVRDLLLGFGGTQLTDQAIENFSTQILPSLDKLERFEVGFWKTDLTSIGAEKFLMNIPNNVKGLFMGFEDMKITDDTVEPFLEKKLPSLTQLREFEFSTSLSKGVLRQIHAWEQEIERRKDSRVSHEPSSRNHNQFAWQMDPRLSELRFKKMYYA